MGNNKVLRVKLKVRKLLEEREGVRLPNHWESLQHWRCGSYHTLRSRVEATVQGQP